MIWLLLTVDVHAKPVTTSCRIPEKGFLTGRTTIEMVTAQAAAAAEVKRAALEFRDPVPTPAGGYLVVKIERTIIEAADTALQVVAFESGGTMVGRYEPESSVANVPNSDDLWWNLFIAPVPEGVTFPLTVSIADKVLHQRCVWSVGATGVVSRLPSVSE